MTPQPASIAPARRVVKRSEHAEAVTLMNVVRFHEGKFPALKLFFAIPNGGQRNKIVAAKMKAEGVKAGVPDYMLPVPRGTHVGLAIELKAVGGRPSNEQKSWLALLKHHGWRTELCVGWEAAWGVIRSYVEAV